VPPSAAEREAVATFRKASAAYARSEAFEAQARKGDAEAGKLAMKCAEDALAWWQWAAATRPDWPQARRNVERALLRLSALRDHAKAPQPKQKAKGDEKEQDKPPEPPPTPETADLPAAQVLGLLDVLRAREREKLRLRRAQRRARGGDVERDW
jgi:hypothetical protein